jgi:hypothetical protein
MNPLYVQAVGLAAPGLDGWRRSQPVLCGLRGCGTEPLPDRLPGLLPPNERRRATLAVRLAFRAAEDALSDGGVEASQLASVFASSDADTHVVHRIGSALAEDRRAVSPTDFHNSVHNAAPGYWSIAVRASLPSNSVSACDASFAAGLLETAALMQEDGHDALLVAYDIRPPDMILAKRPIAAPFGVALVLTRAPRPGQLACLQLHIDGDGAETAMADPVLEQLRGANPAARSLPLLQLLAQQREGQVRLRATGALMLEIGVAPC